MKYFIYIYKLKWYFLCVCCEFIAILSQIETWIPLGIFNFLLVEYCLYNNGQAPTHGSEGQDNKWQIWL